MEITILDWIAQVFSNPFLDWLMPLISAVGNAGIIWIILSAMYLCFSKYRKTGATLALALLLCLLVGNMTLKPLVARERPYTQNTDVVLIIDEPHDYSFPSGHTMSSFAAATVLMLAFKKRGVAFAVLAVLIAFSRLYLYVHYPTDILAGAVIGIALGVFSHKIIHKKQAS